ncbi:MAG: AAA family ATPase [Patescibacteria group bacterium]|nr:AAA family ATPase [Patescibacteria group bacterium]
MDQNLTDIEKLKTLIDKSTLPEELKNRAVSRVGGVNLSLKFGTGITTIEIITKYINWITSLPWNTRTGDVLDLKIVSEELNKTHHGLTEIKERILEYIAVLKLMKTKGETTFLRAPILCFVGLAGTGKTTVAEAIAASMKRKFVRIPLGGMGSSLELRGQSQVLPNSEPGQIIKVLKRVQTKNPVILLDEIDRVAEGARADVMGVLLEVLDPEQNNAFVDNYIDYPFDLSEVLFITTANNTTNISTAVLDRLDTLSMPSYSDEEKITIAKDYMLNKVMKETGLDPSSLTVDADVWSQIVRPLGFDSGIRSLERTIAGICRKVAKRIVEGEGNNYHITAQNVKEFLPSW